MSNCIKCGWCCMIWSDGVKATKGDLKRWEQQGRVDIIDKFGLSRYMNTFQCKYLTKVKGKPEFICGIEETKPYECKKWDFCSDTIARKFQTLIIENPHATRKQIVKMAESLCEEYETAELND